MSTPEDSSSRIFVHEPITQPRTIRLFNLFATHDPRSRLRGSFTLHQLNHPEREIKGHGPALHMYNVLNHQQLPYIAVSYSWQQSDTPTPEELTPSDDDCSVILPDGRLMHISPNLRSFLHRFRTASFDQRFWIDQLCIRQDAGDTARPTDKEQQIPLMRDIYAQSAGAILWVGETSSSEDDEATRDIFQLAWAVSEFSINTPPESMMGSPSDSLLATNGLLPLHNSIWQHLIAFPERRVFSRLWVLQEAVVAPQVLVAHGCVDIDLLLLGRAFAVIDLMRWTARLGFFQALERPETVSHPPTLREALIKLLSRGAGFLNLTVTFSQRITYHYEDDKRWTMEQLLLNTRLFSASQAVGQDRVYALLGLATDVAQAGDGTALPEALVPDYKKTPEQVYREVTEYCLSRGSLAILGAIEGPLLRAEDSRLPSWVPDFSVPAPTTYLTPQTLVLDETHAGESRFSSARVSGDMLTLDGYNVDTIREVQQVHPRDLWTPVNRFEKAANLVDDPLAPYTAGFGTGTRLDAFWLTMTADTLCRSEARAPGSVLVDFAHYVLESCTRVHLDTVCTTLKEEGLVTPEQVSHPYVALQNARVRDMILERMAVVDEADGGQPIILHTDSKLGVPLPLPMGSLGKSCPGLQRILWDGLVPLLGERFWEKRRGSADLFELNRIDATSTHLFFVTEGGLFGLAPFGTQPGDEVFVFRVGGAPPMVLRRAEPGTGGDHTIVGGCYLHGVAALEVLAGDLGDVPWAEVRIR